MRDRQVWEGTGLRGGFAFPVLAQGRIIGVLNFSRKTAREPDRRLLAASRVVGSQIGQFLQPTQAEASLRESEARFRALTQMSSDFFWETDEAHRFTQLVPPEMERGAIGRAAWELPCESPDEAGWTAHRAWLDEHKPFRDFEFARRTPDGVVRHLSVSGDPRFSPETVETIKRQFGLDRPPHIQYLRWLEGILTRGDFGFSFLNGRPVGSLIWERVGWTVFLALLTIAGTWVIAIPLGIYTAVRPRGLAATLVNVISYLGQAVPDFLLALLDENVRTPAIVTDIWSSANVRVGGT